MLKYSLIAALHEIGAIQFGQFKLKSGQLSPIYINLRKIVSYPHLLRAIATAMYEKTKDCGYQLVCGVPYTALPIATCLSLDHNIPMIMRRKEKKDYGTKQLIEGVFSVGQDCLVIEDVITSGSSIMETAADLEAAGLKITNVVALIDREQGGKENLETKYTFHSILTLSEILTSLNKSTSINADERNIIEQFLLERTGK